MNEQNRKLLTRIELEEITGFVQPRKQCERLRENGIFFIMRKDGRPSTTWGHIEYPLSSRQLIQVASDEQPDYDAI
ncbi:DUF4224 domain-containing protein [Yersinia enterocolitica]|uniref:DUF4224 domain-containing protein n=1 Tax=Yersinia enterocolitica TaxID=630 RepID=UPI00155A22DE|nr:DUF4224 domain-containing protein [Yersinia enterocolitica]MBX9485798.1 DUF4224 domain-containing protein [Yersinia enterocolitica]NQS96741.1 DUF4224 domain-containing protein [Yersinia enterocolitica]NQT43418.1 DUF4224 domain-containing protein [Yersinia enterocolitica]NQT98782.1 DUF4224 domain-containing protein [Yersinia enterocolitica]HDL8115266.1 DUF4224 domain-containing protein [Yersinia enterocolitica]